MISDPMIAESGVVIAGTPEECIRQLDDMLRAAKLYGFDIFDDSAEKPLSLKIRDIKND